MAGFGLEDQAQALRRGYTASGFQGAIRSWAASLEKLAAGGQVVYLYALLDDNDRAFAWLMQGLQQKTYSMPFLKEDPTPDDIRSDPRLSHLVRRVGLP